MNLLSINALWEFEISLEINEKTTEIDQGKKGPEERGKFAAEKEKQGLEKHVHSFYLLIP